MENIERVIILGCCLILSLICFQSIIIYSLIRILPIFKILIVEFSLLLVLTCLLGCSVYHVQMWRDSNSDSSLLNKLYTITAVIMQVQSVLLCAKVFENIFGQISPYGSSFIKNALLFSRVFNFFHIISLTILNVYRQYKPTEYLDISLEPSVHWIIFSIEFILTFLYFLVQIWNGCFDFIWNLRPECMIEKTVTIIGPSTLLVCVILLLKVADDGYGLIKRTKKALMRLHKRVASVFRLVTGRCSNQNLVTPFNEELYNEQVQYQTNNDQVFRKMFYYIDMALLSSHKPNLFFWFYAFYTCFRMTLAPLCSWSPW